MTAPTGEPPSSAATAWESIPGPTPPTHGPYGPAATAWFDGSSTSTPSGPDPFSVPPGAPTPPPPPLHSSPPPSRRGGGGRVALALLAAAGLFGTAWFGAKATSNDSTTQPVAAVKPVSQTDPSGAAEAGHTDEPAEAVARALGPAVVQVERGDGLGSGVIYDSSGLIITNAHVVGDATEVNVRLSDGTKLAGQVLGRDPSSDVAVVRVDGQAKLVAARLARDGVQVGQSVYALGSPFGLQSTVTAGIISAVDRPVDGEQGVAINMLQTDAPINPGNSGGALANRQGEIVGINTAIFSQSGENNGIGFSIPIDTAKAVADRIVSGQSLAKGFLGVQATAPQDGSAGALVAEVDQSTPAGEAGVREGDVITAVDGQAIKGSDDLSARIVAKSPGDQVTLTVERDGSSTDITVTLGTRPSTSSSGRRSNGSNGGQDGSNPNNDRGSLPGLDGGGRSGSGSGSSRGQSGPGTR